MNGSDFTVFAYPIHLDPDEDGRPLATCRDFPELATDGADASEALRNAADALDVTVRGRLRRGETVPDPSDCRPGEQLVGLDVHTACRVLLLRWADQVGRGAQGLLARALGKGETHVRRMLSPDGGAKTENLVKALEAVGYLSAPSFRQTGPMLGLAGGTRADGTVEASSQTSAPSVPAGAARRSGAA